MLQRPLRVIGLGSCGTVFEVPGTEKAYKKGTIGADIWRDYCLTNRAHNALARVQPMMEEHFPGLNMARTPLCTAFVTVNNDDFWTVTLPHFPSDHRTRQPLFQVDRISPLPKPMRERLIAEYFDQDPAAQRRAREDPENGDCLVRTYLGERESEEQRDMPYDSLRNFPLRLDMMEEMELDVVDISRSIAVALAALHWQAQIDGMDVEFVLGGSTTWGVYQAEGFEDVDSPMRDMGLHNLSSKRREVNLFLLDFDKARPTELTAESVEKSLVPAFMGNDPYYPMPNVDEELWQDFSATYLKASALILRSRGKEGALDLPRRFLEGVEKRAEENEAFDNAEDSIVFG